MSSVSSIGAVGVEYDILPVQLAMAEGATEATKEIIKALIVALPEKLSFGGLADRHIDPALTEKLAASGEKTQRVYNKLMAATKEFILKNSQIGQTTLLMIERERGPEAIQPFLGSFVLPQALSVVNKLQATQPEALEDEAIWA